MWGEDNQILSLIFFFRFNFYNFPLDSLLTPHNLEPFFITPEPAPFVIEAPSAITTFPLNLEVVTRFSRLISFDLITFNIVLKIIFSAYQTSYRISSVYLCTTSNSRFHIVSLFLSVLYKGKYFVKSGRGPMKLNSPFNT
tara:strand:+ start:167 stop:586 length:420 start_codon:yes stop_codon:yes gene_type:complete